MATREVWKVAVILLAAGPARWYYFGSSWGVAKWFKAPDFESGIRWFESSRPSLGHISHRRRGRVELLRFLFLINGLELTL